MCWQYPALLYLNREKERAYYILYDSKDLALNNIRESRFYRSLNGEWAFKYFSCQKDADESYFSKDRTLADWNSLNLVFFLF